MREHRSANIWVQATPGCAFCSNDIVHLGSCTKAMTATLAGRFIEEGKLRWNTTIAEVFPEWKGQMDLFEPGLFAPRRHARKDWRQTLGGAQ
jgi:CubicO group peptidase (beta-lactamase class C family)